MWESRLGPQMPILGIYSSLRALGSHQKCLSRLVVSCRVVCGTGGSLSGRNTGPAFIDSWLHGGSRRWGQECLCSC